MNINMAVVVTLIVLLVACGKKEDISPPAVTESKTNPVVEPVVEEIPAQEMKSVVEGTDTSIEQPVTVTPVTKETAIEAVTSSDSEVVVLSRTDALELANRSGCLACHSVEKKVVGPAWQDVGARYKGVAGVKARLIDKVKKGGKGNWTEVTGGIPMPPYSPRVPDDTIDKLVSFVLSLPEM